MLLVRGRANSTHVSVTFSLSSALGSVRSSGGSLVRPVDTLRVQVRDGGAKQRLERAAVKRRKGCRRLTEELLGGLLYLGQPGVVRRRVPVHFKPRVDVARPNLDGLGLGVERELDSSRNQRVRNAAVLARPDAHATAPRHFKLGLDDAALQLLLEREELTVQANGPASTFFLFGPWTPDVFDVRAELRAHQRLLVVTTQGQQLVRLYLRQVTLFRLARRLQL